jgi:hypothetical protein
MRQLRRHRLVACSSDSGTWVSCLRDIYLKQQTGSGIWAIGLDKDISGSCSLQNGALLLRLLVSPE